MIKIIHIITGLNRGGAEKILWSISNGLIKYNNFNVEIVAFLKPGHLAKEFAEAGIPVIYLNMTKKNFLWKFIALIKLLKKQKPTIVQTWMYHANLLGGIAARLAGVKNIFWNIRGLGDGLTFNTKIIDFLSAKFSKLIPTVILVPSESAEHAHALKGYPRQKLNLIYNGVDINKFLKKNGQRNALGLPDNAFIFGVLGRSHPNKDLMTFLRAAYQVLQQYPKTLFTICGEGILDDKEISNYIFLNNLSHSIYRFASTSEPEKYLNVLDCFVSSSRTESFPNVVTEAMACERPCIVTNVGDSAVIVGDAGLVVSREDVKALADAMIRMLTATPETRKRMGEKARERILDHFCLEKMVSCYNELYQSCLS